MDPSQGPQNDLLIGQTVGNYLVTQKLGEGGMGAVYLAEHPTIGKKVALKVLHAEFSQNPEVAERFFTEAKAVNAIGHPNIVDIVDYGVLHTQARAQGQGGNDQLVYFIMEYLAGQTLSQIIRAEAPLPPERALTIALQVADALAASHKTQIVHRDLKPDNIILIQRGREHDFVKLLDFGIAKLTSDSRGSHRTRTGLVLGTPAYMSPEQCEGRANVDHRTDIYALGICLYEMLVGRVPFVGEGYGEILVQHLTQKPIEPSRYRMMSPHVEAVVLKALEKRPEMRYPTMDEFIRALADPVGYVEAHGGVAGFSQRTLTPSTAPLPPPRLTPTPLSPLSGIGVHSPVPGTLSQPTTTLSGGAGQAQSGGSKNRMGFIIAGGLVVAAAIVAVVVVTSGGKKNGDPAANNNAPGSDVVAVTPPQPQPPQPQPPQPQPPQPPPPQPQVQANTGSAGSAAAPANVVTITIDAGVAVTPPPPPPLAPDAAIAVVVPQVAQNVTIHVDSDPQGAEIYVDNVDTGQKTPADMARPKGGKPIALTLKLHGYADGGVRGVTLDADATKSVALKKFVAAPQPPKHTNPTKTCDTCLERPD